MIVSHVVGLLLTVPGSSKKNLSLLHDAQSPLCCEGGSEAPRGTPSVSRHTIAKYVAVQSPLCREGCSEAPRGTRSGRDIP